MFYILEPSLNSALVDSTLFCHMGVLLISLLHTLNKIKIFAAIFQSCDCEDAEQFEGMIILTYLFLMRLVIV